jgi:hypothetical protein
MQPASTASLRVASSSFAVMKMTGHFDLDAASRRCSSIPEIPPRWMSSSRQVAVCALPLSSNASAEANVRLSMPLWANSRTTPFRKPASSSTTITTVGLRCHIRVQAPVRYVPRVVATLDLDQRNLVHYEQSGCVERRPNPTDIRIRQIWPNDRLATCSHTVVTILPCHTTATLAQARLADREP